MSDVKYSNGQYIVKHTKYPKNRPFKVQLVSDPNYHTHLRTLKEAIDAANYAKHHLIPLNAKVDYLDSIQRLLTSPKEVHSLEYLIESKKNSPKFRE